MKYLLEIALKDFRCFSKTPRLSLNHVTVLAGPNNSGKSAFLAAIRRLVSVDIQRHAPRANPAGAAFFGASTYLGLDTTDPRDSASETELDLVVGDDVALRLPNDSELKTVALPISIVAQFVSTRARRVSSPDADGREPPQRTDYHDGAMAALRLLAKLPIVLIPERRQMPSRYTPSRTVPRVREEVVEAIDLAEFLLTSFCETPDTFAHWVALVSDLLGASVRVQLRPSAESKVLVAVGPEPARALDDVGCGITELMNIAQAFVKFSGGLMLFEEPELHLHPMMQRRVMETLVRYCTTGQWQAVITTHSNHILDHSSDSISTYAIEHDGHDGRSLVSVSTRLIQNSLFDALGVRASSVLQANAVIWVEGPSDAIYLRHFIAIRARQRGVALQEYVNYGFAFFGGSLLRHMSAAIAPIPELVDLLSVHPKSFVVVDSDRTSNDTDLGKQYTRDFLASVAPARTWVSAGREVENYLADEVLVWAVTDSIESVDCAAPLAQIDRNHGIFSNQARELRDKLGRSRAAHDASDAAKAEFARAATKMMAENPQIDWLRQLDLSDRIDDVLAFIERANGLHYSGF